MAKIQEQFLVVTMSKLLKDDNNNESSFIAAEHLSAIEEAIQSLVDNGVLVEIKLETNNE